MDDLLFDSPSDEDLNSFFPENDIPFDCPYCGQPLIPEDKMTQTNDLKVYFCPHCSREISL